MPLVNVCVNVSASNEAKRLFIVSLGGAIADTIKVEH